MTGGRDGRLFLFVWDGADVDNTYMRNEMNFWDIHTGLLEHNCRRAKNPSVGIDFNGIEYFRAAPP